MAGRPPPGILMPSPGAGDASGFMFNNPEQSVLSTQSQGQQGTQIDDRGVVTVNLIIDDPDIPFMAARDSVRFLQALFPGWSTPAFVGGVSIPNEVGATYALEKQETRMIDQYDGAQEEAKIKRKLTIVIREILNERTVKRINYEVRSKLLSDIYNDPFPPTTYIALDITPFRYEQGKFHLKIKYDGGPPLVEIKTSCFCMASPQSLAQKEHAEEMKPYIYQQADSVIQYVRHFNPNDPIARQVASHNEMYRSSFDDENSYAGTHSKLSKGNASGSKLSKGSNPPRMPNKLRVMRNDSKDMYQSMVSSNVNSTVSNADEIKKLYELYNLGALTKDEFEAQKRKLLGNNGGGVRQGSYTSRGPVSPPQSPPGNFF